MPLWALAIVWTGQEFVLTVKNPADTSRDGLPLTAITAVASTASAYGDTRFGVIGAASDAITDAVYEFPAVFAQPKKAQT